MQVPARPVDLPVRAERRAQAAWDAGAIADQVHRLLPGHVVTAGHIDRIALFAAVLSLDPRVAEARAALETARRQARAARKVGSPTLTLSGEYARDPGASTPWALGAGLGLPLDLGGVRAARRSRADLDVLAAELTLADTIWAERGAALAAVVELIGAEQQVAIDGAVLDLRERQLGVLERRARAGEIAPLLLAPYRAQLAQTARRRDDARARAAGARATLAGLLGLPGAALAELTFDWDDFGGATVLPQPSAGVRASASAARADVLRGLVAYDQAEADLRGEVARQYPSVTLGPGYTWDRGLVRLPFALGLALPAWDGNRAAIAAAEARRAQAGAALETALAAAQAEIDTAATERAAALAALQRLRSDELTQARLASDRAEARLARGAIDRADWAAAQIAVGEARGAELDAVVRLRRAELQLEAALRRPLSGPETRIAPSRADPSKDRP